MAELSLTCPECGAPVNVPIEAQVEDFTCPRCGKLSPIHRSLDMLSMEKEDPLLGAVVSDCEIQEKVGEGGFGAVYRAFDRNLQRLVAVKVMLQSLATNLEFVQKFIREAVTAAQLNHPNIVAIHKVGRDEERNLHYLIMEYLEGRTLAEVIDERGPLPLDEAISFVLQCADALAVAQDKRIIHRDIKPENIMMDRHGAVKITDFGLAKTLTTDMKSTKVVGTPHYMSPEQFEGKKVDGRTDIYSLGITFYYMLTQARPYQGENTVQIIYSILTQDPRPVMEFNPEVPEEIWRIIRKMIAKDLENRYADFREVRRDLLDFQERALARKVICSQCSATNVRGRKFCRECGASLLVKCPACGSENPAGTRHCGECGANIEDLRKIGEHLERAKKLRSFGDFRKALAFYKEVLTLDSAHEAARRAAEEIEADLAEIERRREELDALVTAGKAQEALDLLDRLEEKYPKIEDLKEYGTTIRRSLRLKAVDAHLLVAEKALKDSRLEDAIEAYESALKVDPGRRDIREKVAGLRARIAAVAETFEKAKSALAAGRHADALGLANEVLSVRPDHAEAREVAADAREKVESVEAFLEEARTFIEGKDYDSAISRLETAVEISPSDAAAREMLDDARRRKRDLEAKIALGRRLLAEERPDEALAAAREVLAEHPGMPAAISIREEAENAVADRERHRRRRELLDEGRDAERAGELERALAIYVEVLNEYPDDEKARNLREKVEGRIEDVRRLRRVADEHLAEGRFADACEALSRLAELLPEDQEISWALDGARTKAEAVEGGIRRARDAVKRRRFDVALSAAGEVLEIAPANVDAQGLHREAERGLAAIGKHIDEAERLVDSELFDDAILELNKAVEKGALPSDVAKIRQAADEGKMALLKSEATRSFVFKDFGAAIEKYEKILSVESDDPEALKGLKLAEKRLKARGREWILPKVAVAAGLLVCLFLVQYQAIGRSGTARVIDVAAGPGAGTPGAGTGGVPPPPAVEEPKLDELTSLEARAGLRPEALETVVAAYRAELGRFPDEDQLGEGLAFAQALKDAIAVPEADPRGRLAAFRIAREKVGSVLKVAEARERRIDEAIGATVLAWVAKAAALEDAQDWEGARKTYDELLRDPAIEGTPRYAEVQAREQFAVAMAQAEKAFKEQKNYGSAYQAYAYAAEKAGDEERRQLAVKMRGEVSDAWVDSMRRRVGEAKGAGSGAFYELIEELAHMVDLLGVDREELFRRITED